jgi:hypothetical protein
MRGTCVPNSERRSRDDKVVVEYEEHRYPEQMVGELPMRPIGRREGVESGE